MCFFLECEVVVRWKIFLFLNFKNEKIIIGFGICIYMFLKENNVDLIIFVF